MPRNKVQKYSKQISVQPQHVVQISMFDLAIWGTLRNLWAQRTYAITTKRQAEKYPPPSLNVLETRQKTWAHKLGSHRGVAPAGLWGSAEISQSLSHITQERQSERGMERIEYQTETTLQSWLQISPFPFSSEHNNKSIETTQQNQKQLGQHAVIAQLLRYEWR